jgi:TOBE domain-containing protein
LVEQVTRTGPVVRLLVRLDDERRLEAVVATVDHPGAGDRVDVDVDPHGIVRL